MFHIHGFPKCFRCTKFQYMESLLKNSDKNGSTNCESEIVSNECCMCGDVGFKRQLFKCTSCNFRYQHKYCSSLYPNINPDCFSCEWCRVAEMAEKGAADGKINNGGFDILESKQVGGLNRMNTREECEKKSGLFVCRQLKEKPKLYIYAGRRYKFLADF